MAKNTSRIVIWAMDPQLSLEDIRPNLRLNYNRKIDYLQDFDNLSEHDRTLQNYWTAIPDKEFNINKIKIDDNEISYISATGYYEIKSSQNRAFANGQPLPRELRIFNRSVRALFFSNYGRVFCALELGKSQEQTVKSVLFGQGRKSKLTAWGNIEVNNIPAFHLDSEFFYWVFQKKGRTLTFDNFPSKPLSIVDVRSIAQLSERNVYDSSSTGTNVLASIQALSGLSSNQSVYVVGFQFNIGAEMQLIMSLDSNCVCEIDKDSIVHVNGKQVSYDEGFINIVLMIYSYIYPSLKELNHKEISNNQWTTQHKLDQRKNWALEAIKDLCEQNEISYSELKHLFDNPS